MVDEVSETLAVLVVDGVGETLVVLVVLAVGVVLVVLVVDGVGVGVTSEVTAPDTLRLGYLYQTN